MRRCWWLAGAMLVLGTSASAKTALTPGPKPTAIDGVRKPYTFAHPANLRPSFARDEPFAEGEIAYTYTGRVATPVRRGSDVVAPAGSPAFGVPMRLRDKDRGLALAQALDEHAFGGKHWDEEAGPLQLVWCAATRKPGKPHIDTVCLFNEGLTFGGNDALLPTGMYLLDHDPYGGGAIEPGAFDLGAPVRLRYYVQNLGKIARIKGQIWLGDQMANQWGLVLGDIGRGAQPEERLFALGGGVIGIRPDPAARDHYLLRVIEPMTPGGAAQLAEVRNDSRVKAP